MASWAPFSSQLVPLPPMRITMAKKKPTTKAGKAAKIQKVMSEFKSGTLKSSSGRKVTNRKQGVAIALSEAGMTKKKKKGQAKKKAPKGY